MTQQTATYKDHMGTDLSVVNAARVSFDKESDWEPTDVGDGLDPFSGVLREGDVRLIKYLARHNHWTPFGHTAVTFHFKAPIFVARQLGKHQVGMVWNEVSRRYVDHTPEFYMPTEGWRKKSADKKQGSSDDRVWAYQTNYQDSLLTTLPEAELEELHQTSLKVYNEMLEGGICPEQARMVLPQSMMTEWHWTGSVAAWARVWNLRTKPDTQKETRDVVSLIGPEMERLFPVSWAALTTDQTEENKEE